MTIAWSEELVTDICDHIATGKSMIEVGALQGYPSAASMYRQMANDPDFATRIARAREAQQDYEADAIVRMADAATNDDRELVKLRIHARQWRASKLAPRTYGDSVQVKHADADGARLPSETEAAAKMAAILEAAARRAG